MSCFEVNLKLKINDVKCDKELKLHNLAEALYLYFFLGCTVLFVFHFSMVNLNTTIVLTGLI